MAPYNVYVVGDSGTGKSTLTQGLLNHNSASSTQQLHPLSQNDEFWDSQKLGENGEMNYEKDGNQYALNIQESQGYRSRMGNTLIGYEAAQNAHCVIFCLDGSQVAGRARYGFARVLSYLDTNKNDVKVIIAVTKTDKQTTESFILPADYEGYARLDVTLTNHKQCLDFIVETILNGETLVAIREKKRLLREQEAKDAPPTVNAPVAAPKKSKFSSLSFTKKQSNAVLMKAQTTSTVKSVEKKGLVNKLTELFSSGNKVDVKDAEIPPVA